MKKKFVKKLTNTKLKECFQMLRFQKVLAFQNQPLDIIEKGPVIWK